MGGRPPGRSGGPTAGARRSSTPCAGKLLVCHQHEYVTCSAAPKPVQNFLHGRKTMVRPSPLLLGYILAAHQHCSLSLLVNHVLQSILHQRFAAWRETAASVAAERDLVLRFCRNSALRTKAACHRVWRAAYAARVEREAAVDELGRANKRRMLEEVVAGWSAAARRSAQGEVAATGMQRGIRSRRLRDALRAWHGRAAVKATLRTQAAAAARQLHLRRAAVVTDAWQRAAVECQQDRAANAAATTLAAQRCLLSSLKPWAQFAFDQRRLRLDIHCHQQSFCLADLKMYCQSWHLVKDHFVGYDLRVCLRKGLMVRRLHAGSLRLALRHEGINALWGAHCTAGRACARSCATAAALQKRCALSAPVPTRCVDLISAFATKLFAAAVNLALCIFSATWDAMQVLSGRNLSLHLRLNRPCVLFPSVPMATTVVCLGVTATACSVAPRPQ